MKTLHAKAVTDATVRKEQGTKEEALDQREAQEEAERKKFETAILARIEVVARAERKEAR